MQSTAASTTNCLFRPCRPAVRRLVAGLPRLLPIVGLLVLLGCREDLPEKSQAPSEHKQSVLQPRAAVGSPQEQRLGGKRILLVHSYHPEYAWVDTITQGVHSTIADSGINLDIFYMDTKRHPDAAWKSESGRKAMERVTQYKPDVVLAIDDDAQTYFARQLVRGPIPVVFCGVDADPSKYGYPASNVTGIIERPHFRESIALVAGIRPTRRIAVMSCNDSTSIAALGFMKQDNLAVEVAEWRMVDDFDQWKQAVLHFNKTVDALVIRSYQAVPKPGGKEIEDPRAVVDWTVQNATIPTIAFHDFEIKDGLMLGVVKSGHEYGSMATEYALQILDGDSPGALAIKRTKTGIPMINRSTAARLGINLADDVIRGVTLVPEK